MLRSPGLNSCRLAREDKQRRCRDRSGGAPMAQFEYLVVTVDDGHLVKVSGEVDLATAPQLAEVLGQFANGTRHVFDKVAS